MRNGIALVVMCLVLAATATAQTRPATAPAAGPGPWRVWNSDIHDSRDVEMQSAPAIVIVAARSGAFSGKVVASPRPGLKATLSDLKGAGGAAIPAVAAAIRYAVTWSGKLAGGSEAAGTDILLESPPADMPADRLPIWITVKVPADAKAGTYSGQLTVSAPGNPDIRVPVTLEVAAWTAPGPGDHRTWLELMESPDTLAREYGVPLWSQKHWDLIARSMQYLGEAGSRVLYVPLIEHTNAGNDESMVRWKKDVPSTGSGQADQCEFDFSVMDKYLDLAEKHMGKPRLVVFNVYDRYLTRPGGGGRDFQTQTGLRVAEAGPIVTMLDANGAVHHSLLPDYPPRESVTVTCEKRLGKVTAAEHLQTRIDDLKRNLSDFQEGEKGGATIDGAEAKWASFSCCMGPFRMKALVYVFVQGSRGVQIACLCDADKFEKSRPLFEKIATTLKMDDKELTLLKPDGWEKAEFEYRGQGVGSGIVGIVWGPGDGTGATSPVRVAWKSLFDQLRERMRKRGIEKQMLLGMVSDFWPTKDQGAFLKDVSGNLPWANASHYFKKGLWDIGESVGYHAFYFGVRFGYQGSLYGWKRPELTATFDRAAFLDGWPMARWRLMGEYAITGNVNGVGRLGADTWNVLRDRAGMRKGRVYQRYPESDWGYLNVRCAVLAPGPQGPLATVRYEILREGIQDCEARIVLENALGEMVDSRGRTVSIENQRSLLGPELVKKCREALAERTEAMWKALGAAGNMKDEAWRGHASAPGQTWFLDSNWQERSRKLYALAGEVAAKTLTP